MKDNTEYVGFITLTGDEPCRNGVGIQCLIHKNIGYRLHFHIADDQRDFSEYCMGANSKVFFFFLFRIQIYTTCYKSLFKLLLAELTKWEKVPYSTIITFFLLAQDGCLLSGVQSEGEAEDDPQSSGIVTS
jgi:hypothetical protein